MGHHDHHEKHITIIVNARPRQVEESVVTFIEIVKLAFGSYDSNPTATYSVTWSLRAEHGSMVLDNEIHLKEGMVFNVTRTNKS